MQLNGPLSPALSPSEGEREKTPRAFARSPNSEDFEKATKLSLSPSEGERAGERGPFNCIDTVESGAKSSVLEGDLRNAQPFNGPVAPNPWAECRFLTCSVLPVRMACDLDCKFCFSKSSISSLRHDFFNWT